LYLEIGERLIGSSTSTTFNFVSFAIRSFNFIKSSDLEIKLIVVADPLETKNLVLTHPEIELDLLSQLDAWWK
jgi:hypothetical protein